MSDLDMQKACAEAMGWKYLGAVGVELPEGMSGSEADRLYPGKLWCLSGGNDWWLDPEGHSVCGRCQSIPDPLNDDAQAMALVKRFALDVGSSMKMNEGRWQVRAYRWRGAELQQLAFAEAKDLNRAIVECVSQRERER